jgi:hypothetical protein
MDILSSLNITPAELKGISNDAYEAYIDLEKLKQSLDKGLLDDNLMKVYHSTNREFETFIFSDEFSQLAESKGVKVIDSSDIEDVVIEEPDDLDMEGLEDALAGILADDDDTPVSTKPIKLPTSSVEVDDATLEDELDEILKEEEEEEIEEVEEVEPESTPITATEGKMYGVSYNSSKQGEVKGREALAIALLYGSNQETSSKLFNYTGSYINYMMLLPKGLGKIVISFETSYAKALDVRDLDTLYTHIFEAKSEVYINVTSSSKSLLKELENIFTESLYVNKKTLTASELSEDRFDNDSYEQVNDNFSNGLDSESFFKVSTAIRKLWENSVEGQNASEIEWEYKHGLNYVDYLYIPVQYLYKKGGTFVQAASQVYYSPKIKKDFVIYETGREFAKEGIKATGYDRAAGKISKGEFKNTVKASPLRCDGSGINTSLYFVDANGELFYVSAVSYNYFIKYYGYTITTNRSDSYLQIMDGKDMVGFIPIEKRSMLNVSGMVLEEEELHSEIRAIDGQAYDFLKDATEVFGMSAIGLTKEEEMPAPLPVEKAEDVKEEEESQEIKDLNFEIEALEETKILMEGDEESIKDIDFEIEALEETKKLFA